jgi:hypothetical protein
VRSRRRRGGVYLEGLCFGDPFLLTPTLLFYVLRHGCEKMPSSLYRYSYGNNRFGLTLYLLHRHRQVAKACRIGYSLCQPAQLWEPFGQLSRP